MKNKIRTRRVTLAHVAARAGVSTTTVSLILSGREEYIRQFHPTTINKVRMHASRLGYRTNLFASGLQTKASMFFAVVLRDIGNFETSTWYHWAFEGDLLAGVLQAAAERGVYPIVAHARAHGGEASMRPLESIIAGGVFGAIVRTPMPPLDRYLRQRLRNGQPVVAVFPPRVSQWPTNAIEVDNMAMGQMAGQMLARQGRRKWALIWFGRRTIECHLRRSAGFREAAEQAGARVEMLVLPQGIDHLNASRFLAPKIKRLKVDGLFAVDAVASVGTFHACLQLGWKEGVEYNLVGCDCGMWQSANLPGITSLGVSWREIGAAALDKLCEVAGKGECRFDTVWIPPRVTPAATCPVPPEFADSILPSDSSASEGDMPVAVSM